MYTLRRLDILLAAAGGGLGLLWPSWIAGSLALPLLWSATGSRTGAMLIVLLHQLAASRGLPHGSAVFFGPQTSWWFGYGLWLAAALLTALPYGIFWSRNAVRKSLGLLLALALHAASPVGWSHPISGVGDILPGAGIWGVALVFLTWGIFPLFRRILIIPALFYLPLATAYQPATAAGIAGMDTHFHQLASGSADYLAQYERLSFVRDLAHGLGSNQVLVLPETIIGNLTPAAQDLLSRSEKELSQKHSVILVGAEIPLTQGRYLNALIPLGDPSGQPIVQHVPVPVSMWRPWGQIGAQARPYAAPSVYAGKLIGRVEAAICYEQLLAWPMLRIVQDKPDVLVAASNLWWARDTSIPAIQTATMHSWARLAGIPLVTARNF